MNTVHVLDAFGHSRMDIRWVHSTLIEVNRPLGEGGFEQRFPEGLAFFGPCGIGEVDRDHVLVELSLALFDETDLGFTRLAVSAEPQGCSDSRMSCDQEVTDLPQGDVHFIEQDPKSVLGVAATEFARYGEGNSRTHLSTGVGW